MPALAPASIDMLQTVIRPSIDMASKTSPRYSMMWPIPPPVPILPMIARMTSFGVAPSGRVPSTVMAIVFGRDLGQGLGGEHVLDLAGADAERDGPECAVGRSVGVAADDGHARLGQTLLRADDVHDALAGRAHLVVDDAELGGVGPQGLDLLGRDRILDGAVDVLGRDVVVLGGHREIGPPDRAAGEPEPVECLG